jgi:hypothetical protein
VIPGTYSNEDAVNKVARSVIPIRRARIGIVGVVAVGANGLCPGIGVAARIVVRIPIGVIVRGAARVAIGVAVIRADINSYRDLGWGFPDRKKQRAEQCEVFEMWHVFLNSESFPRSGLGGTFQLKPRNRRMVALSVRNIGKGRVLQGARIKTLTPRGPPWLAVLAR